MFNSMKVLAHLTEMIRAAHPAPVIMTPEPLRARALVALLGGSLSQAVAIELKDRQPRKLDLIPGRPGEYRVAISQMGGIPVVLTEVSLGGQALHRGPAVGAEIVIGPQAVAQTLTLQLEALWWDS